MFEVKFQNSQTTVQSYTTDHIWSQWYLALLREGTSRKAFHSCFPCKKDDINRQILYKLIYSACRKWVFQMD